MKIDISNYFDDRTLVIIDVDSIAKYDFVSSFMGNKGGKPAFSFDLHGKKHNSTIIYSMLSRIVNTLYYIDDVDILVSFDTKPNFLNWINSLTVEKAFSNKSDFYNQLTALRLAFKEMGLTVLEKDGVTNDSLIKKAVMGNYDDYDKIIVYTRDKMLYNLVDEKVSLVLPSSKYDLTLENFKSYMSVEPNQFYLKLTMLGDSTLELKGVNKIGKVKFNKMLEQDLSNIDLFIKTTNLLNENQRNEALAIYNWLQPENISEVSINPKKINKSVLKNYLNFFECNSLIQKVI